MISRDVRLALVINAMNCGGAERVMSILANNFAKKGLEVFLITVGKKGESFFELDTSIQQIKLDLYKQNKNIIGSYFHNRLVKRVLGKTLVGIGATHIVSFGTNTNLKVIEAAKKINVPLIVSERNNPGRHDEPKLIKWLKLRLYEKTTAIVVQSREQQEWYEARGKFPLKVIPNPIDFPEPRIIAPYDINKRTSILYVSRMAPHKGHRLLIEAFSLVLKSYPHLRLDLLGDGSEKERLSDFVNALGIQKSVYFAGVQKDKQSWYDQALCFVLPSEFEGFPNVLIEAIVQKLPVISTNCAGAITDMIPDSDHGIVLNDRNPANLADAIRQVIADPVGARQKAERAYELSKNYETSRIVGQWFETIAGHPGPNK